MTNKLSIQFLLDDNQNDNNYASTCLPPSPPFVATSTSVPMVDLLSPSNVSPAVPAHRHSIPVLQSLASRLDPETSALLQNWQPTGMLKPSWMHLSNVTLITSAPASPVASPRGSFDSTQHISKKNSSKALINCLTFQQHLNEVSSGTKIPQDDIRKIMDSASQKLLEDSNEGNVGERPQEDEIDVFMRRVRAQAYCTILSNTKQFKQKQHTFVCHFSEDCTKMLKGKGNLRRHLEWHMKRLETETREQFPQYSTRIKPQTIYHDPLHTFSNIKIPELPLVTPTSNNTNNNRTKTDVPKSDEDEKNLELEAAQAMTQLLTNEM